MAGVAMFLLAIPLTAILFLVWLQDRATPLYIADRVGHLGVPFRMIKIRSMVFNADKNGVESTSATDNRITPLGHFIRRWKLDELSQLWNVLRGDMSLVGPRPNTINEVARYAPWERELLSVRPGITDFSSIVFSDEGEILKNSNDPNADYSQLIRPWKGKLGILYARNASISLDIKLVLITLVAVIDRPKALALLQPVLVSCGCDTTLARVARRQEPIESYSLLLTQ